ncbi:CbiX/SirB N-terminal domain-containing protein [Candidatus Alkanophaga liquidiphilum]|nr:Sirohydrochlorin ferrochelatase [Candidatus Alkanophaga liquidiphilum]RLG36228.1 MAG: sirohydrochlorin nickelochelatase [Candidatus Alkanophagales archaeon]
MYEDVDLVLVGHGSVLPYNEQLLQTFRRKVEERRLFRSVRIAFLQKNKPTLEETLEELAVASPGGKVLVLPVFLARGTHTLKDIPEILESYGESLRIIYGEPLGADDRIIEVLLDRARATLVAADKA